MLHGVAGHAGTVPMPLRHDALAAAAECVLAVERIARSEPQLVGTVGRIEAKPGAINVIPGEVHFTIDFRAPRDKLRARAVQNASTEVSAIAKRRGVECRIEPLQELGVAACAPWLMEQMDRAVAAEGVKVRCKGGISHNPAESISAADADLGARALLRFIENFERRA